MIVGLDLGATNAKAAVVEAAAGKVLGFKQMKLSGLSADNVVADLLICANDALAASSKSWHDVIAVGVGTPGVIEDGVVIGAANLFEGASVPLKSLIHKASSKSVCLVNDADAALLAELWVGAAAGVNDAAMLTLGSGVGCAIAVAGNLVTGIIEGGHMIVACNEDARPCTCGSNGCLEAYASANSVLRMYQELDSPECSGEAESCADIFALAKDGDPRASLVVDVATRHVAVGALNLIRILDSKVVVLAGGLTGGGLDFLNAVRAYVKQLDWTVLPSRADRIKLAKAGPHTGCIGAAKAARDALAHQQQAAPSGVSPPLTRDALPSRPHKRPPFDVCLLS